MADSEVLIGIKYTSDGRLVEGPADHLSQFIEQGVALPIPESRETYEAWARKQDRPVPDPGETEKEKVEVEEEEEKDSKAPVDPEGGLPEGYEIRKRGSYHTVYGPDGTKIGKGKRVRSAAEHLAQTHAAGN